MRLGKGKDAADRGRDIQKWWHRMLDAYVRDSGGEIVAHADMDMNEHALLMTTAEVVEADLLLRMSDFWGDATFTPDELGELNNELHRVLTVATGEGLAQLVSSFAALLATAIERGLPVVVVPD